MNNEIKNNNILKQIFSIRKDGEVLSAVTREAAAFFRVKGSIGRYLLFEYSKHHLETDFKRIEELIRELPTEIAYSVFAKKMGYEIWKSDCVNERPI